MKKITALIFLVVITALPVPAQMAVIDPAHILETVWNGYQIYQSLQNAIQTLRYTYESVQNQVKMLQSYDFSNINGFVSAVRFADRQLNFARTTENRLRNIRVRVGGKNYNLAQAYELPEAVTESIKEDMTQDMTPEERARAWSHYGLRPINYKYAWTWRNRISETAKNLAALNDSQADDTAESAETVEEIRNDSRETDSTVALSQMEIELQARIYEQLVRANYGLSQIGSLLGDKAMADLQMPQRLLVSDDFLEITDK
jgi:hypothetical protein